MSTVLSQVLAQAAEPQITPVSEAEAAHELPYLFQKSAGVSAQAAAVPAAVAFTLPLGDAVVPGGAAQAPDSETLKKYLLLREQDVAVLSSQLKATKEQVHALDGKLREEQNKGADLTHANGELIRKLDDYNRDRQQAFEGMQSEMNELRFQLKAKGDKARLLDVRVREAAEETERLKERVRTDIRKIRVREKELENRLEIMKKDSEALIAARENKIIELKRKLDLLEFNMDLLQDQHAREKENATKLKERLAKAAQVVRVAGGLLDTPGGASQLAAALAAEGPDGEEVA
jgi:chromosome segregation ATPase